MFLSNQGYKDSYSSTFNDFIDQIRFPKKADILVNTKMTCGTFLFVRDL